MGCEQADRRRRAAGLLAFLLLAATTVLTTATLVLAGVAGEIEMDAWPPPPEPPKPPAPPPPSEPADQVDLERKPNGHWAVLTGRMGLPGESGPAATAEDLVASWDLKTMLDHYISSYHSRLLVFTCCFAGDFANAFKDSPRTATLSSTTHDKSCKYFGYHDDAAAALRPGVGRTSTDVHAAGVRGSRVAATGPTDAPYTLGQAVSLEPTSANGPIRSRHVVVIMSRALEPDDADVAVLRGNFAGQYATSFTLVGGPPTSTGGAQPGYDFPCSQDGLAAALDSIRPAMNENEQFILFVGDHAALSTYFAKVTVPAKAQREVTFKVPPAAAAAALTSSHPTSSSVLLMQSAGHLCSLGNLLSLYAPLSGHKVSEHAATVFDTNGDGQVTSAKEAGCKRFIFPRSKLWPFQAGLLPVGLDGFVNLPLTFLNDADYPVDFDAVVLESGLVPREASAAPGSAPRPVVSFGPRAPECHTSVAVTTGPAVMGQVHVEAPGAEGIRLTSFDAELETTGNILEFLEALEVWDDIDHNGVLDPAVDRPRAEHAAASRQTASGSKQALTLGQEGQALADLPAGGGADLLLVGRLKSGGSRRTVVAPTTLTHSRPGPAPACLLALATVALGAATRPRRRLRAAYALATVLLLTIAVGCGGGRSSGSTSTTGREVGTACLTLRGLTATGLRTQNTYRQTDFGLVNTVLSITQP